MNYRKRSPRIDCPNCFKDCHKKETLQELEEKYNILKSDIQKIKDMDLSEEASQLCIYELNKKMLEVKSKMHDLVNKM